MQTTPLTPADQAEIDKRLNYMEAKDIAMFYVLSVFNDIGLLIV